VAGLTLDGVTVAHLTRESRRSLIHALLATPLDVRDSRGYSFAEVTAGGIPLDEIDPARMESRCCPGLFLVGEILDVDGRLGGFNFQWAWSSAWVAARAIASGALLQPPPPSPGSATRSTPPSGRE
jgi:predicted flavoprotein YhiN